MAFAGKAEDMMTLISARPGASRKLLLALSLSTSLVAPGVALAQAGGEGVAVSDAAPREAWVQRAQRQWEGGDRDGALAAIDAGLKTAPSPGGELVRAELLDALGESVAAEQAYRRARAAIGDPATQRRIDMRLAVMAAMRRPDTLVAFAASRPSSQARPLAQLLALLNRPRAALDRVAADTAGELFEWLERTQWALAAGDGRTARTTALRAVAAAKGADDARYALALLVEAYRVSGDLPGALAVLRSLPESEPVLAAQVDAMLEIGQIQPAIAIIEHAQSPALRQRLTGLLDLAGDQAASEAEFRRMIAADPHQADLYGRLAALYLARGDEAQAVATYRALFAANRGRADVLTAGARSMIGMGLQNEAVALLNGSAGDPAVATATHLFLFEAYLDAGDVGKALAELQLVERGDARGALIDDIADGYERLGRLDAALAILRGSEGRGTPLSYDRRAHIAQLAAATGDNADALRRWQSLWSETMLPARRRNIERQIVALARKTDQLDALVQASRARLDAGTLRAGEIDLLVALYLAQSKPESAADVVRRFAARSGASETATLNQLARLYARIRDTARLETTLRRLVAIDPANRDDNVRRLILELLRNTGGASPSTERQAELDGLMAQLSETDEAGTRAFKAAVYTEAGLGEQALSELRKAFAAAPGDADAMLRLATELKRQRRRGEAIGILQYAAEYGGTAGQFFAAIDGLLDMIADASGDEPGVRGVLGWAKRRVLERIALQGADSRLLGLLADVAVADADYDLQMRATEATVPGAGEQRAAVLRELATLAGGPTVDGGQTAIGDPGRKIVYARRLLALGKSFPPDLYADLARTMLKEKDEAGAERAFALMSAMGGLVNVDETKGDAYAAAGRPAQALTNYARALLQDQSNFDLLVKTSILREGAGQDDLAWRWYWRGLRTLIARQPMTPLAAGDDRDLDVRRYYATMVEGLLLTWPRSSAAADAMLADLQRQFLAEMAPLGPGAANVLTDHPRLALIVDLGHRIADAGRAGAVLADWDAMLDRSFAKDATYRRAAGIRAQLTGRGATPAIGAQEGWPIAALRAQALAMGNDMLRFVSALSRDDSKEVQALLATALAEEEAARDEAARMPSGNFRQPIYILMLAEAMDRLSPETFRDAVLAPLQRSPARDAILFDLFRASSARYARLEKIAGSRLIAPDRLLALTISQSNRRLGVSLRTSRTGGDAGSDWLGQFTTDQLITLYDGLVARLVGGEGDSMISDLALADLLRRPLDAGQRDRLAAVLDRDVAIVRDSRTGSGGPLVVRLLQFEAAAANRPLVLRAAKAVAARYADSAALPGVLERWYAGERTQAFLQLTALAESLSQSGYTSSRIDQVIANFLPDIRRQQIAAFLADPGSDPGAAATAYQQLATDDAGTSVEQRLAMARKMVGIDPGNPRYRDQVLALTAQRSDWPAFAEALKARVAGESDDTLATTMLALTYRLLDRQQDAADVAKAAGVDLDDVDLLVHLLNRSQAMRARGGGGGLAGLFTPLYEAYRAHAPHLPSVVAVAARQARASGSGGPAGDAGLGPLLQAAREPDGGRGTLRAIWRDSAGASENEAGRTRLGFVYTLNAAVRAGEAGAAWIAEPRISAELQRYPAAMAPVQQARQQMLYAVGAEGPVRRGEGEAVLRQLLDAARGGSADADDVRRLMAVALRMDAALAPGDLAVLDQRLRDMPVMSPDGRLDAAHIYARSGDFANAAAFLQAGLVQMLYPADMLDSVEALSVAMQRAVGILALWRDDAARQRVYDALARTLEARKRGPNGADLPDLPKLTGGGEPEQ
ncbi:hypothetical protein DD559_08425 [Sphingomonas pokkalii]|uniref:Tetratricopeptide repeat protein n=2 Tax=Sphingomonas pokkalii TaxID=2175090 RepID=A0A2U0SDH4_9SPHN|nr:hypothetical protein DD559_08425 [Sphingomonas pokkalii]